jgi:hypothetical protein
MPEVLDDSNLPSLISCSNYDKRKSATKGGVPHVASGPILKKTQAEEKGCSRHRAWGGASVHLPELCSSLIASIVP